MTTSHTYRAYLIPANVEAADVERMHAAGLLPYLDLATSDSDTATRLAAAHGLPVHSVERLDGTDAACDALETDFDALVAELADAGHSGSDPTWTPGCGRAPCTGRAAQRIVNTTAEHLAIGRTAA